MIQHRFSVRSLQALSTVRPELAVLAHRALSVCEVDFTVVEGVRSLERQRQLLAQGATTTLNSKHLDIADGKIDGFGIAVDCYPFYNGRVQTQAPWRYFEHIAYAFKLAAKYHGTAIQWGGDWKSFKDGPHIELVWPLKTPPVFISQQRPPSIES